VKFFTARRGHAVAFTILTTLIGVLFSVVLGAWLAIGVGNPATRAINALADDAVFRERAATDVVETLADNAGGSAFGVLLTRHKTDIVAALSDLTDKPEFTRELEGITDSARRWFVDGDPSTASFSLQPIASQLVDTLEGVDPEFGVLRVGVAFLPDVNLASDGRNSPRLRNFLSGLLIALVVLLVLLASCSFGLARNATSAAGASTTFGGILVGIGFFMIGIWFAALTTASSVALSRDEEIARTAIPIVASSLVSPLRTVGVAWIVIGVSGIVAGALLRRRAVAA